MVSPCFFPSFSFFFRSVPEKSAVPLLREPYHLMLKSGGAASSGSGPLRKGLLIPSKGPEHLLAKVKNAHRRDWYIFYKGPFINYGM